METVLNVWELGPGLKPLGLRNFPFLDTHSGVAPGLTSLRTLRVRKEGKLRLLVQASSTARPSTWSFSGVPCMSHASGNSGSSKRWAAYVASPRMADVGATEQSPNPSGESNGTATVADKEDRGTSFEWKSNWYPVFPEIDLDRAIPHPFQILGRKVVIWYDKDAAKWQTFLDICPHRLAPLSEGRINEQGCLQCCYHGWSFKGDGSCAHIPQARPRVLKPKLPVVGLPENKLARAVSFPTVVKQDILFVWPDEFGHELADKTPPPITPGIDEPGWCGVATFRDVNYGYDTGMENLVDPAHVPVAHHNVNGGVVGKRNHAAPLALEVKSLDLQGFSGQLNKPQGAPSVHTFEAPSRFSYRFQLKGIKGAVGATTTYCTPISPGRSRMIVLNARNFMIGLSSGPCWWQLFPRWLDHQLMLNLLDGDIAILHQQERNLTEKTDGHTDKWNQAFFMPTAADRYVGAFRQWLSRFSGKGVHWPAEINPALPPAITKREDLLDRYNSHTKQCVVCLKALENFKRARTILFTVAAVLTGLAALLPSPPRVGAVAVAGVCALIAWWLGGWIQMFYYKGWDHARMP